MSEMKRLSNRNERIAAMLADGEQLKNFYRFIAQNPHINLHDACQIIIERPNATVCFSFNEWTAMGRRVTKGRKGIAYYDNDGYKQFAFDAIDTHGDNRYLRPILPMKHLLGGLDELNSIDLSQDERSDYRKIHKGVQLYLQEQDVLTDDADRNKLLIDGIAYSLYAKTGFPKSASVNLDRLPYSYAENAEFVKDVYIRTDMLVQDIEEAYLDSKIKPEQIINDINEEAASDESDVYIEQTKEKKIVEIHSASITNYKGYVVLLRWLNPELHDRECEIYIGKKENYDDAGHYDNSDNSLLYVSTNENMFHFLSPSKWVLSQQEMIEKKLFTEQDYKEFCELENGILKNFEKTDEIKFAVDIDEKGGGVPFRYPNWQDEIEAVEQTEKVSEMPKNPLLPMYEQYMKAQNTMPNVVVLMRLGDFYEILGEKAKVVADELDLTLTAREVGLPERVPMCGLPYHALDRYLNKILDFSSALLIEPNEEPKYYLSHVEALEQSEATKEKQKPILTEITADEHTLYDDEQFNDDDWRNELAAELGEKNEEQADNESELDKIEETGDLNENDFDDDEATEQDELDEQTEQEREQPKDKVKSTSKKKENGIKDRKRKEKPQVSMFDLLNPQEKSRLEQVIEKELKYGSGVEHGKFRIWDKYQENPSEKTFIEFLKKEYGWGGHGSWGSTGQDHSQKGIKIYLQSEKGEYLEQTFLKWPEVANRIADLIDDDNYLSEQEKGKYVEYTAEQNRQKELRAEEERRKNELINQVIFSASEDRKQRILDEYADTTKLAEFVEFLKTEYGTVEERGVEHSVIYNQQGIWIYKGEITYNYQDSIYLNWNEFADKVLSLIEKDCYIEQPELSAEEDDDWEELIDIRVSQPTEYQFNRFKELTPEGKAFFDVFSVGVMDEPANFASDEVQNCKTIANGIYDVSTVGHGGVMIAVTLAPHILSPEALQIGFIENGYYCYEEDGDAKVTLRELYDKGILNADDYFREYRVKSERPEAKDGYVPFREATETEKANLLNSWSNNLDESLGRWYPEYWQAHEHPEISFGNGFTHEESENTDLNSVLDESELVGAKTKFLNNIAAVKLVNKLYAENRNATNDEKKVLSRFVGWGGLSQAFNENNESWKREYAELKGLLSQEDYEQARSSTLNAFYTAKDVIDGIYVALDRFGVKGNNRILEPSMGTGNFFGYMPKAIADGSRLYGVELDNLTGRIAAKLYPQANVQIKGFEDTSFPDDKFDIVVGNVPFGGYGVADSAYNRYNFRVHDYFLAKSIDKVKPNGIVAIVTSKGTMDKFNPSARKYVAERAELIGAIRLPNTAFKQTAGTEAVADILFFRKRTEKINTDTENIEWLGTGKTDEGYEINNYFINHPEMVLGTLAEETGLYGGKDITVKPDGRELSDAITEAVKNLQQGFYLPAENRPIADEKEVDYNIKPMCYKADSGRLYMRVGDEMVEQRIPAFPKDAYQRICGMIALREELHRILDIQIKGCSDAQLVSEQTRLNAMYDSFVKKYNELNSQTNARLFKDDGDAALLFACEDIDKETKKVSKSEIFYKRTIRPYIVPTNTDDCFEALQISKNERGRVDIAYVEELTGKDYETVLFELGDSVFRNPAKVKTDDKYSGFETAEEYLSGRVVDKLQIAEYYAEKNPEYRCNVTALTQVQPTRITASEISVRLGATWVDKEYYKEFYCELVGVRWWNRGNVQLFYNPFDSSWRLDQKDQIRYETQMKQKEVFGTKRAPAYRLFIDAMNMRATTIYDTIVDADGNERRVVNQPETIAAREKQNQIKELFVQWIYAKPERREEMETTYNNLFNQIKLPSYDGSYLKFPEMNPAIELNPHQRNAVHRIISSPDSTLLHHVVGSGKTFTMVASIMKMRQLGLCKKAMVAVPNHLVEQWAGEWRKLYPNAKILVATKEDLEKDNRRRFVSKVALGDWDGIIIAQSSFAKIPVSQERQINKLKQEIKQIEDTVHKQWEENGMPRGAVKNLERIKKSREAMLKKLMEGNKKDDVLTFENLGVDYLYIDEAHYYKNLYLFTKMNNVAGVSNAASARASDIKLKCEYLQELHKSDRGVVFGTGTPISNSMSEMYTMQNYLQPQALTASGITFFDGWAADFGETITSMELSPSGQGYRARTRFAKFTNLPELLIMYRSFADVQTADMVKLAVPEAEKHIINLKPSDTVIALAEQIAKRADKIHQGLVSPYEDNMLKITSDGKKLALDPRCFVPDSEDEAGSKLNVASEYIYDIWERTSDIKGTQIIFCDLSTPKKRFEDYEYGKDFDAYNDLKYKLVQRGIPKDDIAFIHDANTEEEKQNLFDKVNGGKIRVLIGSTEKCGAGTNVQKRLVALHHLDTPYRPSDLEQREGRIIRQGNENNKVDIYTYVTERTFDSYSYQILENKQKFISQINKGDLTVREAEDIDETTLSYAEIKAITAANPRIKRKMEVDAEITRLRVLEGQYKKNIYELQDKIRKDFPEDIRKQELLIERVTLDLMHLNSSKPENPEAFEIGVNGKVYTDKKEGGKALTEALYKGKLETVVAEYCGFKISMNPMTILTASEREITLTANGQYTLSIGESASGNLTRLENFIEDFPKRKERLENKLKQLKDDLQIAKEQVEKPFEHKEQLLELLSEQTELDAELNLDKKDDVIVGDDDESDDNNYRALPTQREKFKENEIIDKEDKVALMQVDILPDYSVGAKEMYDYGYTWNGMLPMRKGAALQAYNRGVQVYRLGKDDTEIEVEHLGEFEDGILYGVEKPVWNRYLESEQGAAYMAARSQFAEAAGVVASGEMDSIDERFTIDFIETNFEERADLDDYLADKSKPTSEAIISNVQELLNEYTERIWRDELKYYGWEKEGVAVAITNHLENDELKAEAKQLTDRPFNPEKELLSRLAGFSEQETEDMNLPAFDDELTVLEKEPPYMLHESSTIHSYMDGVLLLRNETTGNCWYVINDTSAKNKDGKYIEMGEKTDVKTVLAYNGLYDGNPMREFHSEEEAKAYYDEKIKTIREVRLNSAKNNPLIVGGGSERDKIFAIMEDYCSEVERQYGGTTDLIGAKTIADNVNISVENVKELMAVYGARIDDDNIWLNDRLQTERHIISNRPNYSEYVSQIRKEYFARAEAERLAKMIYLQTSNYAHAHNEMLNYRESHRANMECKFAINGAVNSNYDGMYLQGEFEDALIEKYGMARVAFIVATTINEHEWDGRYRHDNKAWARTIPMSESEDERRSCCLSVHPEILDGFADRIRDKQVILYTTVKEENAEGLPIFNAYSLDKQSGEVSYLDGDYGSDIALQATVDYDAATIDKYRGYSFKRIEPQELYRISEKIKAKNIKKEKRIDKNNIVEAMTEMDMLMDNEQEKVKAYYAFNYQMQAGGEGYYQAYMVDNKNGEIFPIFESDFFTQEELEEKWQKSIDSGLFADVELIKCEPQELLAVSDVITKQNEDKKIVADKKETPKAAEKLKVFVDNKDSVTPVYYYFICEMSDGGKTQYQAYLLNYGDDEIYPFFENGFATQDELEQAWNNINENGIYASVDFHNCDPQVMLRIRNQNKEIKEKNGKLAQDKFRNFTARGDKVLSIIKDRDDRNIAIIQREKLGDFVVAARYDTTDGTWAQGTYDFKTLEAAEQYRTEKYGFENTSDTVDKKWLTCKVSPKALIKKYQFNSRLMMPKGSGYEGYAYSIFNDRIREGTITDVQSDTRERVLVIRIPDNQNVEISGNGETVEIEPHEFIRLVNETMSDKYEREQRYSVGFSPEAFIKEYETSMLLAMPNDTKYKGYVYYLPKSVITEDKYSDDGMLIANIGESFKVTLRKGEERVELTAKEYLELVGDKKADKYGRDNSVMDEYREQQGEVDKKWATVAISENAVIANYQNSTLFKMPKGDYAGFVYYIPSGMVRKDENGLSLRVPEDFTAHLKDGDNKKDLSAQEFIAAIAGKTNEDYESVYRAPSEEAKAQFAKVEQQLRRNVPEEMRNKQNWVVVRTRENEDTGRLDKFLINPHTGKFAESDNPETWSDFDTACKYARESGGVCLAYALEWDSDIACIDLDGCFQESGDFSEIAQKAFNAANGSYAEKSVSGKGLHIFGKTKGSDLRSFSKDKTMEYYQGGHFIAMTGDYYGSSELKSFDTPEMQSVLTSKLDKRTEWKNTGKGIEGLSSMDDREMLEKAFAAKNGDNVKRLYGGEDVRGNHSNSDMSLMNYLAFWSNHDIDQMLRVFSTSGLYRAEKPQSYYEHTAIKAIKGTPSYTPPKASNSKPSGKGNSSDKGGK